MTPTASCRAQGQALVDRLPKANVALNDTPLWWVAGGFDAIKLVAKAVEATGSTDIRGIIGYWNTLPKYPGYFGDLHLHADQHNGYPTDEIVMSEANSAKNGAFALAPGYT